MTANNMLLMVNGLLGVLIVGVLYYALMRRKNGDLAKVAPLEREILTVDEEIVLRSVDMSEVELMFQLMDDNRKYLKEWLPWLDDTKDEAGTGRFIGSAMTQRVDGKAVHYSIYYKDVLVGIVGQTFKPASQMATVGYWLGESFQDKGIMTRSVKYLVNRDFKTLNINRVEIRVATSNIRSRAIPERLDFKEEGRLRSIEWLYDHYVDHVVYGRLKSDDWKL